MPSPARRRRTPAARDEVAGLLEAGAVIVAMTAEDAQHATGHRCTVTLLCRDGTQRTLVSDDEDLVDAAGRGLRCCTATRSRI